MIPFSATSALIAQPDLDSFNREVLACQDQVFCLAMNLLDDERLACALVQEAFQMTFRHPAGNLELRLAVLRAVVRGVQRHNQRIGPAWLRAHLSGLSFEEKLTLILVDCIELSYAEAALVLNRPADLVTRSLARARYRASTALRTNGNNGEKAKNLTR